METSELDTRAAETELLLAWSRKAGAEGVGGFPLANGSVGCCAEAEPDLARIVCNNKAKQGSAKCKVHFLTLYHVLS